MASLALAFDLLVRDNGANRDLRKMGDTLERTGDSAERTGSRLGTGLKLGALAAAAGIGVAAASLVGFIGDAKESQRIGKLTEAVLKSTGGVAGVSAEGVDKLATALSNKSAVDDELIANSANVLLTFTNIRNEAGKGNDAFDQAAEAALNISAALGTDLQSASVQVGKALNDPIKGLASLSKAGIQFTDDQKEQIKVLVEAGDTLGAQKIILGELETQFGGAAEAAASPIDRLKTVLGNLSEEVGGLLLPTVERFADYAGEVLAPKVAELIQGFEDGTGAGGRLRDGFTQVYDGAVVAFTYVRDEVIPRLTQLRDFVRDEVVPRVQSFSDKLTDLRDRFQKQVLPKLREVADYLTVTFTPTFQALVDLYEDNLKPAIERITEKFRENEPQLRKVQAAVAAVAGVVFFLYTQYLSFLLPILVKVAGFLIDTLVVAFEKASDIQADVVDIVTDLYEGYREARDNLGKFIDKLKDIEVPKPLRDIADIIDKIADGVGGAAGRVSGFVSDRLGDIAGNFRGTLIGGSGGGNALARVQSILPAGMSITSTYRSPSRNAAVGGSPTSLHMDRANPAVDIAGTTAQMDAFAQILAANGPWRQLLWRVPDHYDHIHVAHNGGIVDSSWPTMPGLRSDERPAILQTGERVQSRAELAAGRQGGALVSVGSIVGPDPHAVVRLLERKQRVARVRAGMP